MKGFCCRLWCFTTQKELWKEFLCVVMSDVNCSPPGPPSLMCWQDTLRYLRSHPEGGPHRRVPPQAGVRQLSRDPCGGETRQARVQAFTEIWIQKRPVLGSDHSEVLQDRPRTEGDGLREEGSGRLSEHADETAWVQNDPSVRLNSELKPQEQQTADKLKVKMNEFTKTAFYQRTLCKNTFYLNVFRFIYLFIFYNNIYIFCVYFLEI